jgi:hypothetical protein
MPSHRYRVTLRAAAALLVIATAALHCAAPPIPTAERTKRAAAPGHINELLAVIGDNDIVEVTAASVPQVPRDRGRSVAILLKDHRYRREANGDFTLTQPRVTSFCPGERFENEPVDTSVCTGFLIGDHLLATADHCFDRNSTRLAVFGYRREGGVVKARFAANEVCLIDPVRDVLRRSPPPLGSSARRPGADWALVKLRCPLPGLDPLVASNTPPRAGDALYAIHHSAGLPQKYSSNGVMKSNPDDGTFLTTLDATEGSSGAPVFSAKTDQVVGLIKGSLDQSFGPDQLGCLQFASVSEASAKGEAVTAISAVDR